jgi:hypothetical protein
MRKILLPLVSFAVALAASPTPAGAHHASICKAQAAKISSKSKRVRVVSNCMAAHPHDREHAKR